MADKKPKKKGTFHDVQIGLIIDMHNKNSKLRSKIETRYPRASSGGLVLALYWLVQI